MVARLCTQGKRRFDQLGWVGSALRERGRSYNVESREPLLLTGLSSPQGSSASWEEMKTEGKVEESEIFADLPPYLAEVGC
jgi:hypothetical protein